MPKLPPGIRKRWNGYFGRWYEDGRRHEKNLGPSLVVARRCLDELRRNARLRAAGLGQEIVQVAPLAPLVEAYHMAHAPRWKPKYAREVRVALAELLDGIVRVADLTAGRVEAARDRLPGSARTRNKKAAWVLSFARWLRRTGQGNPPLLAIAPVPRADVRRRRVLARDEVARLVEHGGKVADLVALLAGTGLRLGEALRLRWRDLTASGIHVATSKNGDARTVPITGGLRARLLRLKARRGADDDGPVIVGATGHAIVAERAGRWLLEQLRRALDAAGVAPAGVDFHCLRHTYATELASAGATMSQLQALCGWRSPAMAGRYVHRDALDLAGIVAEWGRRGGGDRGAAMSLRSLRRSMQRGEPAPRAIGGARPPRDLAGGRTPPRVNAYRCHVCAGVIFTVDVDVGVTPFLITCRASVGCSGMMRSAFYSVPPEHAADARWEWYRPAKPRAIDREHVERGGLVLRERRARP